MTYIWLVRCNTASTSIINQMAPVLKIAENWEVGIVNLTVHLLHNFVWCLQPFRVRQSEIYWDGGERLHMICLLAVFNLRCIKANKVARGVYLCWGRSPQNLHTIFVQGLTFNAVIDVFWSSDIVLEFWIAVQAGEAVDNCKRFHLMLPGPIYSSIKLRRNQVGWKIAHLSILSGIKVIHLPRSAKDGYQIDQFWQGGEPFFLMLFQRELVVLILVHIRIILYSTFDMQEWHIIEFFPDFMMDGCCHIFEEPLTMLPFLICWT